MLITGSTDGVGLRVAERLARAGATVLVHGRDVARAERLCGETGRADGTAIIHRTDLTSLAQSTLPKS
jgi:NAD(P)-dependent dehydrogenase (short-subunit alcohol dehydrogenase family)